MDRNIQRGQKAITQIRLDPKTYEQLKYIAEKELRSINAQMEYFIIRGIDEYLAGIGMIWDDIE